MSTPTPSVLAFLEKPSERTLSAALSERSGGQAILKRTKHGYAAVHVAESLRLERGTLIGKRRHLISEITADMIEEAARDVTLSPEECHDTLVSLREQVTEVKEALCLAIDGHAPFNDNPARLTQLRNDIDALVALMKKEAAVPACDMLYLSRQLAARLTELSRTTKRPVTVYGEVVANVFLRLRQQLPAQYDNAPYANFDDLFSQYAGASLVLTNDRIVITHPDFTFYSHCPALDAINITASMLADMLCEKSRAGFEVVMREPVDDFV